MVALENIPILGNLCDVYNLFSNDENYMCIYVIYIWTCEGEKKRTNDKINGWNDNSTIG